MCTMAVVIYMLEPDVGFAYEQPQKPSKRKGPQEKSIRMYEIYIINIYIYTYPWWYFHTYQDFRTIPRKDTKTIPKRYLSVTFLAVERQSPKTGSKNPTSTSPNQPAT